MKSRIFAAILLCLGLFAANVLAQEPERGHYYRYMDDNGSTVIKPTITPERVPFGYEVLNETGRVLRVVERQKTEAELAALSEQEKQNQLEEEAKQRQREYDVQLLRKYSFVTDLESERDRKMREMNVRSTILDGNLFSVRSELESEYSIAAAAEKKGRKVSPNTQKRIAALEEKLTNTEELKRQLHESIELTRKEYLLAIDRLKLLLEARNSKR